MQLVIFADNWDHSEESFYNPIIIIAESRKKAIEILLENTYGHPKVVPMKRPYLYPDMDLNNFVIVEFDSGTIDGIVDRQSTEYYITEYVIEENLFIDGG